MLLAIWSSRSCGAEHGCAAESQARVRLFDAEGDTLSIGLGLPMFIRGMSDTVKTKLQHYGVENLDPGDILLTNDAYITGSHLNHMTFTVPIFTGPTSAARSTAPRPTSFPKACRCRS
jgi:N-methylhydantoinase B/oxoprolinase/acetone carboxylase alpha subunit